MCHWNVLDKVYLSNNYIKNFCLPLCPLECNKTEFKYLMSMSQLNGFWYVDFINKNANLSADFAYRNVTAEKAAKSFVSVNIYYDSLAYTLSREIPKMNIVSLLANMGGTLGLFMGVSVFSIYEIIEVLLEIYFIRKTRTQVANFKKTLNKK